MRFSIDASQAREVSLAGNFNNWEHTSMPLKRTKNGTWKTEITLKPGRYEYKFVVDGNWIKDPNNSNSSWNSYGSENSMIELS